MIQRLLLIPALLCFIYVSAQQTVVPGQCLVQLKKDIAASQIEMAVSEAVGILPSFKTERCISEYMHIWLFSFNENEINLTEILRLLNSTEGVQVAQANHVIAERIVPNDPFFGQQWHHVQSEDHDIDSDLAWEVTTGGYTATGDEIVVCVIEPNGATWNQADIIDNHWINENEISDNGIDDDNNGYIDDVDGWNINGDDDNIDGGNHGTQVSSMIGAKGDNGTGITGVNWDVKIMQVQMGGVNEANVIEAYEYPMMMRKLYNQTAGQQGAFVVATNSSWGTDGGQPEDAPLWCAMYDSLGVYGIISCGATTNSNDDVDVVGDLPTACPSEFLLSVTATGSTDARSGGYGLTTIDLGAPGTGVYLANNSNYASTSGTSFASPCVAGAIALIYSAPCTGLMEIAYADPAEAAGIVYEAIMNGTDDVSNLSDECVTGGRLNVNNSIAIIMDNCQTGSCIAPFGISIVQEAGTLNYSVSWSATPSAALFGLRYRIQGNTEWIELNDLGENEVVLQDLTGCSVYELELMSLCSKESSEWGNTITFQTDGCCVNPVNYVLVSATTSSAEIQWADVLAADGFIISYGPTGGPFITVNDVQANTYFITDLQPCTEYLFSAFSNCIGPEPLPTQFIFNTPGCGDCQDLSYCTIAGDADLEYIANVTLGDINHTSESDDGYILIEDQTTLLQAGSQHTIFCTPGFGTFSYDEYFKVWIDYNANGEFEEPSELVFDALDGTTEQISGTFIVPLTVQDGVVRMRVGMSYIGSNNNGDPPVPCGENEYGETEDYCVTLDDEVGVDEWQRLPLSIYPNPSDGQLYLNNPNVKTHELMRVQMIDAKGNTVLSTAAKNHQPLDISHLAVGLYQVRIVSADSVVVVKVVKR